MIRSHRLLTFVTLAALLAFAGEARGADGYGKLAGTVLDADGTPQMGASIWLNAEPVGGAAIQLLTNQNGVFSSQHLRPGLYSARVTLLGFLPSVDQHIRVQADLTTIIHIQMESVLASFDQLRRAPAQPSQSDDWKWVLRSSPSTRPILQWQDGTVVLASNESAPGSQDPRMRVDMITGGSPAGSVHYYPPAATPATQVSYDQPLGDAGRLLLAGQMNFGDTGTNGMSVASIWLPSGELGNGPETTVVMRQAPLMPGGPMVREMRAEHTEQMSLTDALMLEYGAEYLMTGVQSMHGALRPHGRLVMRVSPDWMASFSVETEPSSYAQRSRESAPDAALDSAVDALDTLPQRVWDPNGQSYIAGGWHEELAVRRAVGSRGTVTVAGFHDFSDHQEVFGSNATAGCAVPQPACSSFVYAHDAGSGGSFGTRVVYREKISDNLELAAIYAWAGALALEGDPNAEASLASQLQNKYVHSVAGRVSGKIPRVATQLTASYKWVNSPVVGRQDVFGEAALGIDPNLSVSISQPLPMFRCAGHWELMADVRNVLAQGYTTVQSTQGPVVLVPVMRSFRGGLSLQF